MNVYLPGARLPSTYQEVEWIGRNGNNYIETGWIPTTNFTVKVGYKIADSGYRYVILSQYGGGAYNHAVALEVNSGNVSNNTVRFYCGNTPTTTQFYSSNSLNLNSFNDITITAPGTINVNGTTTTNSSMYTGTYDNKTCRLFIDNDTSFSTFSHNSFISYCKIYEGSTLVRDFIPCYRKSDSVIGLYDLANNQFYTNSGTGTFTKGNDVTMAVLKNAYIGKVYEYSYNFRNKSTTQLSNDGFSVYEGTWKVNASGLSSNNSNARVIVNKSIQSLLNATKLTVTQNCILSNGSVGIRLNGTGRTYATGMYMGTTENYQTLAIAGTANNYSGMSSGTYTQTATFDFVNKTATLSCTGKSDHTETMTDTQINNIKNNINNIEFYIDRNSSYIQTVNIVVCY